MDLLIKNAKIPNDLDHTYNICVSKGFVSEIFNSEEFNYDNNFFNKIIDIDNKVIMPAFTDVHSKSEVEALTNPQRYSALSQGILLEVIGQDGFSVAPVTKKNFTLHSRYLKTYFCENIPWNWQSVTEFLSKINDKTCTNYLFYAPYGTIRLEASLNPVLSSSAMNNLIYLFEKSLDEGACGLSISTSTSPSSLGWASDEEIKPLLKILAKYSGVLSVSLENTNEAYSNIERAFQLAKDYKLKLHISRVNLLDNFEKIYTFLDKKRKDIDKLIIDVSPYNERELSFYDFMPEVLYYEKYETIKEKLDKDNLLNILLDEFENKSRLYDDIKLLNTKYDKYKDFKNCLISNMADYYNLEVKEVFYELFMNDFENSSFTYELCKKEKLAKFFELPFVVPATNSYHDGKLLPDMHGAMFHYIEKFSGLDALNIYNKLYKIPSSFYSFNWDLKKGAIANFVVLELENIKSNSSFINPKSENKGVYSVISKGKEVYKDSRVINYKNGKILNWI